MRATRTKKGMALVSIIVLSATSFAFLLALAAIVTQANHAISVSKWNADLTNGAEVGLDWAIAQYTASPNNCPLDPPSGSTSLTTPVPEAVLTNLRQGMTISVTVKELSVSGDWTQMGQYSIIYNKQFDPTNMVSTSFTTPLSTTGLSVQNGGYRIVSSTATIYGVSRTTRTVLMAQSGNPGSGSGGKSSTTSFFANPLFSNGPITFNPSGSLIVSEDSGVSQVEATPSYYSYNLNVSTNVAASIGSNTNIQGNLNVTSSQSGSNPTATISGSGSQIQGRVTSNGDTSVVATPGLSPGGSDNVLANADSIGSGVPNAPRSNVNDTAPSQPNGELTQYAMAPANQASPETAALPTGNVSSGDYVTTGFDNTGGGSPISYGSSSPSASPMRMFVQDNGDAINISTANLTTPSGYPANFQVWYSGDQPLNIQLSGNSFNGLVYAPFAPVNVSGNGTFAGAIVGGTVNFANSGNVVISSAVTTPSGAPNAQLGYDAGSGGSVPVYSWVPVTWQELPP